MIYSIDINTPKDTTKANLKQSILKVTKGLVYRVEIEFPVGCAGHTRCAIFDGGHPVWPSSLGEFFRTDGYCIAFDDTYLKQVEPFQFEIFTYNLDDTYAHSVLVRVGMVSHDIFMARYLPSYSWKYYKQMLEELRVEEERRRQKAAGQPLGWIEE